MDVFGHILDVKEALNVDYPSALNRMAVDLSYIDCASIQEASHGTRARRQAATHQKVVDATASLYKGIPDNLKDVGHSAVHAGFHASQVHGSKTASAATKARAHDDAHDTHMTAAEKFKKAGHEKAAIFHVAAADTHARKKKELKSEESAFTATQAAGVQSNLSANQKTQDRIKKALASVKSLRAGAAVKT